MGREGKGARWALLVAIVWALTASSASAASWDNRRLTGEAAKVSMFGVSCPTAALCVAVGGNNTIASSSNPRGGLESWSVVHAGAGALPTEPNGSFPGRQIRDVDCPTVDLCVAVTFEGNVYTTTTPTGPAEAWAVADLDGGGGPNTHFYDVSCPSTSLCVAVADGGRIATSTNPTGGPAAWSVAELALPMKLRGVSCASSNFCVAVADFGHLVASSFPTGGASAWVHAAPLTDSHLFAVSCALPSLCVTGNTAGVLFTSTDPLGPAPSWPAARGGGTVQIEGASCVSSTRCVAVDSNGDVLTSTNPTGGSAAWTYENLIPFPGLSGEQFVAGNHFFDVSCASVSFCAIAANDGQILTSGDPFAASPGPAPKRNAKGKGARKVRKGPKRPRAQLGTTPPPGVETERRRAHVRYRFFVRKGVYARGFVCKIDRRPARPCRSPKSYRLGHGRHVFRVRAIGWSGLRGPAAVHRVKVCQPTVKGWCLGAPKQHQDLHPS